MAAFDIDDYMERVTKIKKLKLDSLRIHATDIERLINDVRSVSIRVHIPKIIDAYVDWNFENNNLKPSDLALELSKKLNVRNAKRKQELIDQMTEIIKIEAIKQAENHLSKQVSNTRKKKVSASTIACPECDSLFKPEDEIWKQCGASLKKKQNESKLPLKSLMDTKIIGEGSNAYQINRSNRYSSRQVRMKGKYDRPNFL